MTASPQTNSALKFAPEADEHAESDSALPVLDDTHWQAVSLATSLDDRSKAIRKQIIRVLAAGQRGHLGAAFSLVEICRVLFDDVMRYDAADPQWDLRDRFILSKGHGCMALYVMLAEKGFFAEEELWKFCHPDGNLGGHPDHKTPGVEASTGSLGHGLSIGVGMALACRIKNKSAASDKRIGEGSGNGKVTRQPGVFVVLGDGESNEGSVWEAALCAGKHQLANLTVLTDYNKHQAFGESSYVQPLGPLADKWRAFGFAVEEVDGHDVNALRDVLERCPLDNDKPTSIICHTVKTKGIRHAENDMKWHHVNRIDDDAINELLKAVEDYK